MDNVPGTRIEIPKIDLEAMSDEQLQEMFERADATIAPGKFTVEDLASAFAIVWAVERELTRRGKTDLLEEIFAKSEKGKS
jgi:hypothetical protein